MTWDILLFSASQEIESVENIDGNILVPTDFDSALLTSFLTNKCSDNHIEIVGDQYSIEFTQSPEEVSNKMVSITGEKALLALVEVAAKHGWQLYDCALKRFIDLENPCIEGGRNHQRYVEYVRGPSQQELQLNPQRARHIILYKIALITFALFCISPLNAIVGIPLYAATVVSLQRSGLEFRNRRRWELWPISIALFMALISIIIRS